MQTNRYYVVDQIMQALYTLMGEKDYADITVTEVIKRAQVSRASFYRHFRTIGDVIDRSLESAFDRFSDESTPVLLSYDEKKIREFLFAYTYRNMEMNAVLAACLPSNTAVIFSRAMSYLQSRNRPGEGGSPEEKYRLYARVGLMNSVLMKWLADGRKESVEEIVNYIMKCIILI